MLAYMPLLLFCIFAAELLFKYSFSFGETGFDYPLFVYHDSKYTEEKNSKSTSQNYLNLYQ